MDAHRHHRERLELNLLHLYADIMQERFGGRAVVDWQIAAGASVITVPALLLQPILEDAFRYGIEQTTGVETIRVAATHGLGRLRALYGDTADLDVANHTDGGVIASVSLPISGTIG